MKPKDLRERILRKLILIQLFLPLSLIVLYPLMPGSPFGGEPLGLSQKSYFTVLVTFYLCILSVLAFIFIRLTYKQQPNQPVDPNGAAPVVHR